MIHAAVRGGRLASRFLIDGSKHRTGADARCGKGGLRHIPLSQALRQGTTLARGGPLIMLFNKKQIVVSDVAVRSAATGAVSAGALALGAFALGATAVGALAIGALAIGRIRILEGRIERLTIVTLTVKNLNVLSRGDGSS